MRELSLPSPYSDSTLLMTDQNSLRNSSYALSSNISEWKNTSHTVHSKSRELTVTVCLITPSHTNTHTHLPQIAKNMERWAKSVQVSIKAAGKYADSAKQAPGQTLY